MTMFNRNDKPADQGASATTPPPTATTATTPEIKRPQPPAQTASVPMSAGGVSKGSTLAVLCDSLQITPGEVLAFGDMPNDLPMLRWAGRSVAVSNAHPEVLATAGEVTASCDEDGVARVLERLL